MKKKLFALVDANNFYASCEKIFRPDLADKPVVVLSNNDGCIVARSKEAKALGISMAVPYFKVQKELERHKVSVFSSNYALYGDISQRIMSILEDSCPQVEQYSIDEAFLILDRNLSCNAKEFLFFIKERIFSWLNIHVSIGLAQTRTLAKIANYLAKQKAGIYYLDVDDKNFSSYLEKVPVKEVWGIGRSAVKKLENIGITNALQLQQANDNWLRKNLTVTGWNTVLELRGIEACEISSIGFENNDKKARKSLVCSRSFAQKISEKKDLEEALSYFASNAAVKLRRENLLAKSIQIHFRTSKFSDKEFYAPSIQFNFSEATADSRHFLAAAKRGLEEIYKEGHAYAKAGVMLLDLVDTRSLQGNLLSFFPENEERTLKSQSLMKAFDKVNTKFGKKSLYFGAEGKKDALWHMKQKYKSQACTSSWQELPLAKCK